MKKDWFKEWFNSSQYLNVYKHRDEQDAKALVKLILDELNLPEKSSVLDLACGAGRHSILFAQKHFDVTAIDLSENLLEEGISAAARKNLSINFIQSDIRDFSIDKEFDLVINLFTSFGYFENDQENFNIFNLAYRQLKNDGYFVFDYLNPENVKKTLIPYSEEMNHGLKITQRRRIIDHKVEKEIEIEEKGESYMFRESVKLYNHDIIIEKLKETGFSIFKIFGDFNGVEFDENVSNRMIIFSKK